MFKANEASPFHFDKITPADQAFPSVPYRHALVSSEKDMNQEHRGLSRGKMLDRFKSPVSLMLRLCSVIDSSAGTLPPFASKGGYAMVDPRHQQFSC
jgi:hypothetical protein